MAFGVLPTSGPGSVEVGNSHALPPALRRGTPISTVLGTGQLFQWVLWGRLGRRASERAQGQADTAASLYRAPSEAIRLRRLWAVTTVLCSLSSPADTEARAVTIPILQTGKLRDVHSWAVLAEIRSSTREKPPNLSRAYAVPVVPSAPSACVFSDPPPTAPGKPYDGEAVITPTLQMGTLRHTGDSPQVTQVVRGRACCERGAQGPHTAPAPPG